MCIRDRHDHGRSGPFLGHDLEHLEAVRSGHRHIQQGQVEIAFPHGPDAVSYTHLDVYKRQLLKEVKTGVGSGVNTASAAKPQGRPG